MDIAQNRFGRADIGGNDLEQFPVRFTPVIQLRDGDIETFLKHRTAVGREPDAADVEHMTTIAKEADRAAIQKHRRDDRDVMQMSGRLLWVVCNKDIAG